MSVGHWFAFRRGAPGDFSRSCAGCGRVQSFFGGTRGLFLELVRGGRVSYPETAKWDFRPVEISPETRFPFQLKSIV